MDSPLCSVVIITWNRRREIEKALDSVFAQTCADRLEVVVIDNASQDDTVRWLREEYPHPVRLFRYERNMGCSISRNAGIRLARAPYVCFLDSDAAFLSRDAIERCVEYLRQHPGIRAVAGSIWLDSEKTRAFFRGGYVTVDGCFDHRRSYNETADPMFISTCFAVWEKRLLEELRGFDPSFFYGGEDSDLAFRAWANARRGRKTAATRFHIVEGADVIHEMARTGRHFEAEFKANFECKEPLRLRLVFSYGGLWEFLRVLARGPFRIGRMERESFGRRLSWHDRWRATVWWPLRRLLALPFDYARSRRNHLALTAMPAPVPLAHK